MDSMEVDGNGSELSLPEFIAAAGELASSPGTPSDEEVHSFLDEFPLEYIFRALQNNSNKPELEQAAVGALEKVFSTKYGSSLLPATLPAAHLGLGAASPSLRRFACIQISKLLEDKESGARYLEEAHLAGPLLQRMTDDNPDVAVAASQALEKLASTRDGLLLLFSDRGCGEDALARMAAQGRATVRMRVLSLAASITAVSPEAAEAVARARVAEVLTRELEGLNHGGHDDDGDDVLAVVSALEIVAELASSSPAGAMLVAAQSRVPALLCAHMQAPPADQDDHLGPAAAAAGGGGRGRSYSPPLVRARAAMAAARLISPSAAAPDSAVPRQEVRALVLCMGAMMAAHTVGESMSDEDAMAAALDAVGVAGLSRAGAEALLLLMEGPRPAVAAHVSALAFKVPGGSAQLAAVHALASIAGAERGEQPLLSAQAEERLQEVVYDGASRHVTPGAGLWALLQQAEGPRMAAYRLITALVVRPWALAELCAHTQTVAFITDPHAETNKTAMEWRHAACVAAATAAAAAARNGTLRISTDCLNKLDKAARHGPYLTKELAEAIPIVTTDERPPLPPPPPA